MKLALFILGSMADKISESNIKVGAVFKSHTSPYYEYKIIAVNDQVITILCRYTHKKQNLDKKCLLDGFYYFFTTKYEWSGENSALVL